MGFPAVQLLKAMRDTLGVSGAKVTCVWTQIKPFQEVLQKTAKIWKPYANSLKNWAGLFSDAWVMSARDLWQKPIVVIGPKPFIDADISIFIDKHSHYRRRFEYFSNQNAKGKILMSCFFDALCNECRIVNRSWLLWATWELATAVGKKKDLIKIWRPSFWKLCFRCWMTRKPGILFTNIWGKLEKTLSYIKFENGLYWPPWHLYHGPSPPPFKFPYLATKSDGG